TTALATLHTHGTTPDWTTHHPHNSTTGSNHPVPLPTYPFQHKTYWLHSDRTRTGDLNSPGQGAAHALLGAVLTSAADGRVIYTGRLHTDAHPWLADHALTGVTVLPPSAFVDLVLHAARDSGLAHIQDLDLLEPLPLPENTRFDLQVALDPADQDGRHAVTVHARPVGPTHDEKPWTLHATGVLVEEASSPRATAAPPAEWPPRGATAVDPRDLYAQAADRGHHYGNLFQGLRAVWHQEEDSYADVALPEGTITDGFVIHPALLDAALHVLHSPASISRGDDAGGLLMPLAWRGVTLHEVEGPLTSLRVHLTPADDGAVAMRLDDADGVPVAEVAAVSLRPLDPSRLATTTRDGESLYELGWETLAPTAGTASAGPDTTAGELAVAEATDHRSLQGIAEAITAGEQAPGVVLAELDRTENGHPLRAAHTLAHDVLDLVQQFLTDEQFTDSRLHLVTRGAVSTGPEDNSSDVIASVVWGLVRSAQSEHPGRISVCDLDTTDASRDALVDVARSGEPQVALRGGTALVPRLARTDLQSPAVPGTVLPPDGTVLVTGGTGALGGLLARHLVSAHGVRHLLLASRRGMDAPGAAELQSQLVALGAEEVRLAACDTSDRQDLEELLNTVPPDHPLAAVVHTAGVLDDAVITALTADQLDNALKPKADAAWHLHELTRDSDLAAFVLFSSAAGTLGSPGQGGYAAANTFLDALAAHRQTMGLPGTSLAWGLWAETSGMTEGLTGTDLARMNRTGVVPLSSEVALAHFDTALAAGRPLLLPVQLSRAALRTQASLGNLPPLLRGLVPSTVSRTGKGDDATRLRARLGQLSEPEREQLFLKLVRTHVATVLGHAGPDVVDPDKAFQDLGFNSLAAIELRNRLTGAVGLRLPATLIFDHPTPASLARYLDGQVSADGSPGGGNPVVTELNRLDAEIDAMGTAGGSEIRTEISVRLKNMLRKLAVTDQEESAENHLDSATDDELFEALDRELGIS
ncbi:type I polyketide synthase, partial [Streptomyces sp. NPDC046976]|uniref:type I polyketide synthase n=1 Tax=Streptomyces sp. NPDC046976 TaxID=3155258 RepID=UPI0033FB44AA